ncbi:MAG: hypothetical protein R3C10_11900 [Pirellulales bacterium]
MKRTTTSTTRSEHAGAWAEAIAMIRGPVKFDRVTVVAFAYANRAQLDHDYGRSAEYPTVCGSETVTPTAHLGKTAAGQAFVDFGWRRHLPITTATKSIRSYYESPTERIRVPVGWGGNNRPTVMKQLASSTELWVVFCLLDSFEPAELEGLWRRFGRGVMATGSGKYPIELKGLGVFGKFVPLGMEEAY